MLEFRRPAFIMHSRFSSDYFLLMICRKVISFAVFYSRIIFQSIWASLTMDIARLGRVSIPPESQQKHRQNYKQKSKKESPRNHFHIEYVILSLFSKRFSENTNTSPMPVFVCQDWGSFIIRISLVLLHLSWIGYLR